MIYKTAIIVLAALFLEFQPLFSQDADNPPLTTDSVVVAVKAAIKDVDLEKEQKHAQLVSELKVKLDSAAQDWLESLKAGRQLELNELRYENWELDGKINYPVPYDYYLRDSAHTVGKTDLKEDSLVTGYKGIVNILEKLYIEAPHSSSANDISKYFYTLSRTITLDLEYTQDKFIITGVIYGPFRIVSGWQK